MSESAEIDTKWVTGRSDHNLWYDCEDAVVLYHRPSGRTHFLNASSKTLLTEILASPRDLASIVAELGLHETTVSDDSAHEEVAGLLIRFEHLGLVERV